MSESPAHSLLENLRKQFPCENVNVFGRCLIIPSRQFRNEWQAKLESEGCKIFSQSYRGESSFFVRLNDGKAISNSTRKEKPSFPTKPWTHEEVARLKKLESLRLPTRAIAEKLGRSESSIRGKLRMLRLKEQPASNSKLETNPTSQTSLIKEILACASQIYPKFPNACAVLLREASNILAEEKP